MTLPRPGQPHRTCAQQFFRGLPEAEWSPELNAKLLQTAQTKVAMYDAFISEMEEMAWDEAWLKAHSHSLGSRPVRVLTTGNNAVGHLPARNAHDLKHTEYEHEVGLAQARWLALSSNAKQIFVRNSSEYVEFDAPDAVVDAIRDAYRQSAWFGRRRALLATANDCRCVLVHRRNRCVRRSTRGGPTFQRFFIPSA